MNWTIVVAVMLLAFALNLPSGDREGMRSILDDGAKIEKVADGFRFTEGPVWDPRAFLLFSDIPANTIYKWTPGASKPEVFLKPSGHSNGLTLDRQGRLILCQHDRKLVRREKDGKLTVLAEKHGVHRLNSPNDVVVKSNGSIYFTDPPYGITKADEELGFYGVYRIKEGKPELLVKDFVRPNGLAFSPDEKSLYVDDSQRGHIRVFDVKADGTLANGRVFAELKNEFKDGVPDGMKVDTKGNVYCTGPEGIWVFDPLGKLLGKIIPPEVPANIAWGDADYRTLYITARTGLYRIRLKIPGIRPAPRP